MATSIRALRATVQGMSDQDMWNLFQVQLQAGGPATGGGPAMAAQPQAAQPQAGAAAVEPSAVPIAQQPVQPGGGLQAKAAAGMYRYKPGMGMSCTDSVMDQEDGGDWAQSEYDSPGEDDGQPQAASVPHAPTFAASLPVFPPVTEASLQAPLPAQPMPKPMPRQPTFLPNGLRVIQEPLQIRAEVLA